MQFCLALCAACVFTSSAFAASWPPGGETPSPITRAMHLPASRFVPSTKRWNLVWADQLIPGNISAARLKFAAEHYAATQKIWSTQADQFRAFNPNFLVVAYHLAAGLNPNHNDDCPNPKSNSGTGNIGVVAPKGFVGEYQSYFAAWLAQRAIDQTTPRYESMYQHFDAPDSAHRVWHQDPAWLMDLQNADWQNYAADITLDWMNGNANEGCFFDVAVETNSSLYNPKASNPSPGNFDWWAPPHGPNGEASQTTTRAAFSTWMNARYRKYFQSIYKRFHTSSSDYLIIPNTDQMVTTVYDPVWTDGDANGETIDGAMMEGFGNYTGQDMWLTLDRCVRHITGRGKILIAQCYNISAAERLRRAAMYMLVKNENSFINILNNDGVEWYPEYEIDLGDQSPLPSALDSMRVSGQSWQSVWQRNYEHGTVLVNTSTASLNISVPASETWARLVPSGGGKIADDGSMMTQSIDTVDVIGTVTVPASGGVILRRRGSKSDVSAHANPESMRVQVTPNPCTSNISVAFSLAVSGPVELEWYSIDGKRIAGLYKGYGVSGQNVIDCTLPESARGAFLVVLKSGGKRESAVVTAPPGRRSSFPLRCALLSFALHTSFLCAAHFFPLCCALLHRTITLGSSFSLRTPHSALAHGELSPSTLNKSAKRKRGPVPERDVSRPGRRVSPLHRHAKGEFKIGG